MSDQDFFFDEDETGDEEVAEKPARKAASSKPAPRQSASKQPAASAASVGQTVTMTVAGLIAVVALLVGVIIGILIPAGGSTSTTTSPASTGSMSAPELTDEQIQQGTLPQGHPDISNMGANGAVPTGTVEATTTE